MATAKKQLKRYQLQWRPSFPYTRGSSGGNGGVRVYVLGEKTKYVGPSLDEAGQLSPSASQDPNTFSLQEIIRVGYNSTLILPFNTGIALAQEYTPGVKNKIVKYETMGGNTITTFGQGFKSVGLRVRVIKAGRNWEIYEKGLEALTYLSSNVGRFYGSLYLIGYDTFADGTQLLAGRYKVVIETLDFQHRSSENTTMNADVQMTVINDYGNYQAEKDKVWGSL